MKKLIIILMLILPLPAYALHPAAQRNLYEAQELIVQERYQDASQLLTEFIERRPAFNDARLEFSLANALSMQQDYVSAAVHYQSAIKLDPAFVAAWINSAKLDFDQADYLSAAQKFTRAYELEPQPRRLYQASVCYLQADKTLQAKVGLEKLILAEDAPVSWLNALLQCYLLLEQPDMGIQTARRILAIEPEEERWWTALARCHLMQSDYAGALVALKSRSLLIEAEPEDILRLADLSFAAGLPLESAVYYTEYIKVEPDDTVVDRLINAYLSAQQPELALTVIDKYLTKPRLFMKGRILYQQAGYEKARECFINFDSSEASLMAGYCSVALEDYVAARLHFSRAAKDAEYCKRAQAMLERLNKL